MFAVNEEFALGVTDVLARRFRVLFVDLTLAQRMVAPVAAILAKKLKWKEKTKKAEETTVIDLIESLRKSYQ
ncbi:hypothetical protein LEP1GSC170_0133 [Leptospira interrogans serovar Bataviae str. HAI135]|nr:hypothetical protein LEP1GSC170_0133 [Leptospira interrogans serovar Bataviae str. HAI135]